MKTLYVILSWLFLYSYNAYADSREMMIIINDDDTSGYEINWISIKHIPSGFIHYDGDLLPMTQESQYASPNPHAVGGIMILGAAYNSNSNSGTNGIFGYGLYYVEIRRYNVPVGSCYIDTRDCNYGYDSLGVENPSHDGYTEQDFDLRFTPSSSGPGSFKIKLRQGIRVLEKTGAGTDTLEIWDLAARQRSIQFFQNFRFQNNSLDSIEVKVGNVLYKLKSSDMLQLALGSTATTVTVQNRIRLFPPPLPNLYLNFSSWENGQQFDTVRTITSSVNLTSITANYVLNFQDCSIGGPSSFVFSSNHTYTAYHQVLGLPTDYEYYWYIKYDNNGTWQDLGQGPKEYSFIPIHSSFELKCYLKDKVFNIGVWSPGWNTRHLP